MEVSAKFARTAALPWVPMLLMPVGDIQYDGPNGAADLPRLQRHLAWGMEQGAYFIGMGDFVDFMSPSNRDRLATAGLYDTASSIIDRAATTLEEEILALLAPTRGRWVGLLQGHHYFSHLDGTTSDTRFAQALAAPFLGDCALMRWTFRHEAGGSVNVKVWAHHGHGGGGILPTAGLNKLYHQKVRYPNIRLFLMGHVPQLGHVVTDGLDITGRGAPHIIHDDTHYVLTGGFARGYLEGSQFAGRPQGGYAEKRMLPPAVLGGAVITLTPEKHGNGIRQRRVDIKVSS
mgnify:FL=1